MALHVVGAGLGRTGTHSLKIALEQLLDGRCYHMSELFGRTDDTPVWHAAARGEPVDWDALLAGFVATVDWPACAFWREIHAANPDAVVVLSTRGSAEAWWESFERTIVSTLGRPVPADDAEWVQRRVMTLEMLERRFDPGWRDRTTAVAAYDRHNDDVRSTVPDGRLVEWRPGDGWEPICAALDVAVPSTPFPHVNTTADFRSTAGLDEDQ